MSDHDLSEQRAMASSWLSRTQAASFACVGVAAPSSPSSALVEFRRPLTVGDVEPSEGGLRALVAAKSWHAAGALAERLEGSSLDAVTRLPTATSLRFTVVRLQVYVKLQQWDAAQRLVDGLGNLDESRFMMSTAAASAKFGPPPPSSSSSSLARSIVPFSLHFLKALLPALGPQQQQQVSVGMLYALLGMCREAQQQQRPSAENRLQWRNRTKRVTRALVALHFELEQYSMALQLQRDLADSETNELQHLLSLQHLGCLCLRAGNSFLAAEVFKSIEALSKDDGDEPLSPEQQQDLHDTKQVIVAVNQALLLTFHGYFAEACLTLRNVLTGVGPTLTTTSRTTNSSSSRSAPGSEGDAEVDTVSATATASTKSLSESAAVRYLLYRYAANSLCACLPFLHRNDAPELAPSPATNPMVIIPVVALGGGPSVSKRAGVDGASVQAAPGATAATTTTTTTLPLPKTTVASLIQFLESYVRQDPVGMLSLDATLVNLYRLYELEGGGGGGGGGGLPGGGVGLSVGGAEAAGAAAAFVGGSGSSLSTNRHETLDALVEVIRESRDACIRWKRQ